jgi:hypothetical protein
MLFSSSFSSILEWWCWDVECYKSWLFCCPFIIFVLFWVIIIWNERVAQQAHRNMMCYSKFYVDLSLLPVALFLIPCFNCCIKMKFGIWKFASNPCSLTFFIQQSHHWLWPHTMGVNSYLSSHASPGISCIFFVLINIFFVY